MDRILAIAELRLKLALRKMRGAAGSLRLVGAILLGILGGVVALTLAAGLAAFVYGAPRDQNPELTLLSYLVAFHAFLFVGIVLPLISGALDEGFDVAPFRVYPIGRLRLFAVQLVACLGNPEHLFYYPALLAVLSVALFAHGLAVVPALLLAGCALLFYVTWGNALTLFLSGIMRRRKIKEIVTIVVLVVVVGLSLVPSLLHTRTEDPSGAIHPALENTVQVVIQVGRVLPPSLVASGFAGLHAGDSHAAGRYIGLLFLWIAGGVCLGHLMLTRYHLGSTDTSRRPARPASAPGESTRERRLFTFDHPAWRFLPIEVRAVAAKDLHYLFRSVIGKFSLLVVPVFVVVMAVLVSGAIEHPVMGMAPPKVLLFGLLLYALLFSNSIVNNAYAWEAEGAKAYFICPVGLSSVIAGKNVAVWIFNAVLLVMCLTAWFAVTGLPDALTLLDAILLYAFGLLAFTSVGNVLSVLFPVRRNMSAMGNQPSRAAVLLTLLTLVGIGVAVSVFLVLPLLAGMEALQPVSLAIALLLQITIYRGTLGLSARLLEQRRDRFLEALKSVR